MGVTCCNLKSCVKGSGRYHSTRWNVKNPIFDAEEPFTPRGCVAQAWSVAEVLRCWVKTRTEAAETPADRS